jgi:archaellum component FlaC
MAWGKRSGGGGGVAWLALLVSLAALFLSWKAYERTGGELGELRVSGTESGSDWGEDLDRARERLLERRGDVEAEEDLEGVRRDVAEIREDLERLSEDAGAGARERWRSLDAELERLEKQLRQGSSRAVGTMDSAIEKMKRASEDALDR